MSPESQIARELDMEAAEILRLQADKESALETCKKNVEDKIKAMIDSHSQEEKEAYDVISQQLTEVKAQLSAIQSLFEQGKTTLWVLKWVGYVSAGLYVAVVWAKDHVKL